MSFYEFGITFRHDLEGIEPHIRRFGNLVYKDSRFPKMDDYEVIKQYLSQYDNIECFQAFEELWILYNKSLSRKEVN